MQKNHLILLFLLVALAKMLNDHSVDVIKASAGSYESRVMMGKAQKDRTLTREAYVIDFARDIQSEARMPVMVKDEARRLKVDEDAFRSEG